MRINFEVGDAIAVSFEDVSENAYARFSMTVFDIIEDEYGYAISGEDGQEVMLPNADYDDCEDGGVEYHYGDYNIVIWRL